MATATASLMKTSHSIMVGTMYSSCRPFFSAVAAMASAAAMAISSVMVLANTSKVPRKMPGKPRELLIWLGKSDRPVPMILAPASLASQGQISGMGLAQAKTIASSAMPATHSGLIVPGPGLDAATHTSAPSRASAIPPARRSAFVLLA